MTDETLDTRSIPENTGEVLRRHGLRATRTRLLVLEFLRQSPDHPTVSDISTRLHSAGRPVRQATLYQCLDRMVHGGLLASFVDRDGLLRFDANVAPHHHLRCSECGLILDTGVGSRSTQLLAALLDDAAENTQPSWLLTGVRVELQGMCPSCREAAHES